MVVPFMTIYLTRAEMGYSVQQAGIVMAIFGFGAVCGGYIGGRITDKLGFYHVQLFTLTGGGLLFILLGQMHNYPAICICTFLLSIVNEAFRPANSTAIAHYSKEENRTRSYSLNRLAINLGWAVGGALGGLLASINYELLFWVDGITNIIAAFLLRYFLSQYANTKKEELKKPHEIPVRSAYTDKQYLGFILLTVLFAMCFFQLFTMMPVFYKQTRHFTEFFIGSLMAINGLIITGVEMVLVFKLEGRRQNLVYISSGIFLAGISFWLMNLLPATALMAVLCMIVVTFGEILSMPFMNSFWISRTSLVNRGQYAGLYTIAWSSAQVLGPLLGSVVAAAKGFTILWWITGGLCISASLGFRFLRRFV